MSKVASSLPTTTGIFSVYVLLTSLVSTKRQSIRRMTSHLPESRQTKTKQPGRKRLRDLMHLRSLIKNIL